MHNFIVPQPDPHLLLARRCLPQALALAPSVAARLSVPPARAEQVVLNTLAETVSQVAPLGPESADIVARTLAEVVDHGVLHESQPSLIKPILTQ